MNIPAPKLLFCALLASATACAGAETCKSGCANEPEPIFQAAQLAPPSVLNGPNYRVIPEVPIRGFMAHFIIDTPYGPLHADSVRLLAIRVGEVPAIETLENASKQGAFAHALAERGKKTGSAIVNVFTHPIDSITGLPMGVVRYFKKQIDTWSGRAQSASDRTSRVFENKGDPYRAPPGPMTAARDAGHGHSTVSVGALNRTDETDATIVATESDPALHRGEEAAIVTGASGEHVDSVSVAPSGPAPMTQQVPADSAVDTAPITDDRKNRAWYARAGSEVGRETKRYLKYSQARNEIAKYLGVDPNSSNPYLVERLDSLAWAATWGNFSAGEALGQIVGTAAEVITDTGLVNQYVLTHTPEQIRERNEKNLATVCSDEFDIRTFSRRGGFNDTLRTQFTDSLVKLKPEKGCNELLELAAATHGEVEARFLVDALALIERHAVAVGGKLLIAGAAIAYLEPDVRSGQQRARLLLPLPVDYLSWTADIDEFFNRSEFTRSEKTVLIGGDVSPLALQKLGERGWQVTVRAPFGGAPNYSAAPEHFQR